MVSFLERRGLGDVETEGLVMVALLSSFGARERTSAEVDAAAHIIEQGLLGQSRRGSVGLPLTRKHTFGT